MPHHMTYPAQIPHPAACVVEDDRGFWACLLNVDGDIVTLSGPYRTGQLAYFQANEEIWANEAAA